MNINGLMNLLAQQWRKPSLEPAAAQPAQVQLTDSTATPAAVYHPSGTDGSEESPTYQASILEVWGFDSAAYEKADQEMWDLRGRGLARHSE